MDKPPGPSKPANATIQLDRLELDELLLVDVTDPSAKPPASLPPPLPPEEIARAASFAPGAPVASQSFAPANPEMSSRRMLFIGIGFAVLLAVAIGGGVAVGGALRRDPKPVASALARAASASALPSATAVPATITVHTFEMGGKPSSSE